MRPPDSLTLPRRRSWRGTALLCLALLSISALPTTFRHARAASLLMHVLDPATPTLPWLSSAVDVRATTVGVPGVRLRARLYTPVGKPDAPGLVLLHGVHPRGIDEPRLIAFAQALAQSGIAVLTPELPELRAFRIEATTVERIALIARTYATRVHSQAVGVMGVSFAGGLALIAADQAVAARSIAFVIALGAHHDLQRLCRYYAGINVYGPHGERPGTAPHPYGARVILHQHLERFFNKTDLSVARSALDTYLDDQHARARNKALALSPAGQATMAALLDDAHPTQLNALLVRAAALARDELAAASPRGHLARVHVPVFLIHGESDPVIPSIETMWLAHEVPARALRKTVITPLLRHAEFPGAPSLWDAWDLVTLMADVLHEAEKTRATGLQIAL